MTAGVDPRPRHQQIAADLRARIMSGDLAPGSQLPTTQQLADEHAVTGQTVQRALAVLKAEGFAVGRSGLGVFVRAVLPMAIEPAAYLPPAASGDPARWTTEAQARSQQGRAKLLRVATVVPPTAIAVALRLQAAEPSLLRQLLLSLDDEPVELASIYLRLDIAAGTALEQRKLVPGGIPKLLADLGYPPASFTDQVSARLPTTAELTQLALPPDVPVLRTMRTVFTADGMPIEASVLIKGSHRYELAYRQPIAG